MRRCARKWARKEDSNAAAGAWHEMRKHVAAAGVKAERTHLKLIQRWRQLYAPGTLRLASLAAAPRGGCRQHNNA